MKFQIGDRIIVEGLDFYQGRTGTIVKTLDENVINVCVLLDHNKQRYWIAENKIEKVFPNYKAIAEALQ